MNEGAVCKRTPIGDNDVFALECAGIKDPSVTSVCKKGVCVATFGCDGKPLTGAPNVSVDSGGSGTAGGSGGSSDGNSGGVSGGTSGSGTLPSGNDPLDAFNPPAEAPAQGSNGGSTDTITINPDGIAELPEVSIVQQPSTPGSSGAQIRPGTTEAKPVPVWNPGAAGENNWLYPDSTFGSGASMGSSVDSVGGSLLSGAFSTVVGNLIGNLFGGLSGNGSAGPKTDPMVSPNSVTQERPTLQPILNDRTNATLDRLMGRSVDPLSYELPRDIDGFPMIPPQSNDRTGLSNDWFGESLTGGAADPTTDEGNPTYMSRPESSLQEPVRLTPLADAEGNVTPYVLKHPDWWTPEMVARYAEGVRSGFPDGEAYQRTRAETITTGLEGLSARVTSPDSVEGQTLRKLLEEDVRIARQTRDRAYMENSLGFFAATMDRLFGHTAGQRALNAATERLSLLGELEGRYGLAETVGGEPRASVEILITDQPVDFDEKNAINLFDVPGILASRGLERVRTWWSGPTASVAVPTPPTPQELPSIPTVTPSPPVTQNETPEPSSFLERLSAVANRVREAVGFPVASKSEGATKESVPQGNSNAAPSAAPSVGGVSDNRTLSQRGMALLNGFIRGLSTLLSPAGGSSNATPAPTPSPVESTNAAAAITANPSVVAQDSTTQLSWSSTGTRSCAIVDSLLNVIARGTIGATTSPTISVTTRFGIICDIANGEDKFLNEVEVRVEGGASSTPPLFSNSGRASTAVSSKVSGDAGGTQNPSLGAPIDVRTCNPEQDMNSFIRCLCESEPNPAGCAIPPGGV